MFKFDIKISEFAKVFPILIGVIFIGSSLIIFSPSTVINQIGVNSLVQKYHQWIGIAFIISTSIIIVFFVIAVYKLIVNTRKSIKIRKSRIKYLHNLTPDEKEVLREYIDKNSKTTYLRIEDGVVKGLEYQKIIYRSSDLGSLLDGFAYNIQPWAWDYLRENSNLLK